MWLAWVFCLAVASAQDNQGVPPGWEVREGKRIRVVHPASARSRAREVAEIGPGLLQGISEALGEPGSVRDVIVYLAPSPEDLRALENSRTVPRASAWAAGYTLRGQSVVVLTPHAHRGPLVQGFWQVLHHEMVHVRMGQLLGSRGDEAPTWFWEGTASVLAHEGTRRDLVTLARTALRSGSPDLETLVDRWPRSDHAASAAYVVSYAFVSHLAREHGTESLGSVVRGVAAGEAFDDAFRRVYGSSWHEAAGAWESRFLWVYRWVPILTSGSTLWLVVTLIFALAAWRKRRRAARVMAQWEAEEQWEAEREEGGWVH